MPPPKNRDVCRTHDGADHENSTDEVHAFAGFFVHDIYVVSAHPVVNVGEPEEDDNNRAWEAQHWEKDGWMPQTHYHYNPSGRRPTNPSGASGWPIIHDRHRTMTVRLLIGFWPVDGVTESVDVDLTFAGTNITQRRTRTPDEPLCLFPFDLPAISGRIESWKLMMLIKAQTTNGCAPLGEVRIEFEAMTVVAKPIPTLDEGEYKRLDEGVTQKRVRASISEIGGLIPRQQQFDPDTKQELFDLHEMTRHLVSLAPAVLEREKEENVAAAYYHPVFNNYIGGAWRIFDVKEYGGECQAIVRLALHVLWQLGITGPERRNVWVEPVTPEHTGAVVTWNQVRLAVKEAGHDGGGLKETYSSRSIDGHSDCYLGLLQGYVAKDMVFNEDVKPPNRYEACVKVTTRERVAADDGTESMQDHTAYYLGGGGGASFKKPEDVVWRTFNALVLFRWLKESDDQRSKTFKRLFRGRNYRIMEVVCRWK